MGEEILLALSTFPDVETARRVARQLVTENFAACANIIPAIESIYRWKEKIATSAETLVVFKLSEDRQSSSQEKPRTLHPYELPEIISSPIACGLAEYLRLVVDRSRQRRP